MAGSGSVAPEDIDLPHVRGDGVEGGRGGDDVSAGTTSAGEDGGGDAAEEAWVVIGGGAKGVAGIVEAESPGVVVELVKELEIRAVFLETVDPHAESLAIVIVGGVSDGAVELVIESVAEVGRAGMGVAGAPAGEDNLADVRFVVAVGVFQKEGFGGVVNVDASVCEGERGGDVEAIGKDGDLVAASIAIGVFEDFDLIVADTFGFNFVRVVDSFGGPEAAAFVPSETDGIDDLWFGGEEFKFPADGDLRVFQAIFRAERVLILKGLGALFVVGDVRAGFVSECGT